MINPICEYCGRHNPAGVERCQACGAPLPYAATPEARVTIIDEPELPSPSVEETLSELLPPSDQLQESLKNVGAVAGTLGVGAIILRVAAQGIAIAVSAFLVGLAAGGTAAGLNRYLPHLLTALIGGVFLGIVITVVRKRTIWTLLAAPVGSFLGYILSTIFSSTDKSLPLAALLTLAGGVLFAALGGRRARGKPLPCLKVLQPILGAIGGLFFAGLGFAVMYRVY